MMAELRGSLNGSGGAEFIKSGFRIGVFYFLTIYAPVYAPKPFIVTYCPTPIPNSSTVTTKPTSNASKKWASANRTSPPTLTCPY